MRFVFNEQKAAEAAAHLLVRAGGRMEYIKLIKLLYLADRDALVDRGVPITGDRLVSMDKGPVLSHILDLITDGPDPARPSAWFQYVSAPERYEVGLVRPPPDEGDLSEYEIELLDGVFDRFGALDRWVLVNMTHELPEWKDPKGSSRPIDPSEILRCSGTPDEVIESIAEEAEHMWFVDRRLLSLS